MVGQAIRRRVGAPPNNYGTVQFNDPLLDLDDPAVQQLDEDHDSGMHENSVDRCPGCRRDGGF